MTEAYEPQKSPLATKPVGGLILKFAIPAVLSMIVSALYNIVDQIFIGQKIGMLGNGATNVAFPIVTICTALALLLGIGSASNFNLEMGRGDKERATYIIGNGTFFLASSGILLCIFVITFLKPLILAFGATENVFSYAMTYTGVTTIGIPFLVLTTGGCHMIRADGSPAYAMISSVTGAILNVFLDWYFIFGLDMGIAGAAWATVIGQVVSALLVIRYLFNYKSVNLTMQHAKPQFKYFKAIVSLGVAACFNQLSMTVVQIVMNNTLTFYGAQSIYGSDIPLACVGVITKVNMLFISVAIGIAQGCQPIFGFNYGAKNFDRVKETYFKATSFMTVISIIVFICFQLFPRQIVSVFGNGSDLYFEFAEKYFHIFMFMTFANGIQPITANFFTSIGKAKKGIFISMTRQILFLLPLLLIFPIIFGIDGVMYAGPIADFAAAMVSLGLVIHEMKLMKLKKEEMLIN